MKKIIAAIVILIISVSAFMLYSEFTVPPGKAGNAQHGTEHGSEKFTDEEINRAIKAVKRKFRDFEGCTLKEIHYDEEYSAKHTESYLNNGKGSVNGATEENTIVLLSSFYVDETGGDGSFNADSTYSDWNWILIRDSKNGDWTVDDWGY